MKLPEHTTPDELAEHLGVSKRTLREKARELGTYRVLGKNMILLDEDVSALLEALKPCHSNSASADQSGTCPAPLPVAASDRVLARLTDKSRKGSGQTSKARRGEVVSMDQRRM